MPQATKTDEKAERRDRLIVSLPMDLAGQLDEIGAEITDAVERATGGRPTLTRAQVVASLVNGALKRHHERNGDTESAGS